MANNSYTISWHVHSPCACGSTQPRGLKKRALFHAVLAQQQPYAVSIAQNHASHGPHKLFQACQRSMRFLQCLPKDGMVLLHDCYIGKRHCFQSFCNCHDLLRQIGLLVSQPALSWQVVW